MRLKEGNEGLGTAWSCAHGVDRWRRDCGCSTGGGEGWNQKWREPFRVALDLLRDRLYEASARELSVFLKDPWQARNDYIDVVMADPSARKAAIDEFISKHRRGPLSAYDVSYVLRIPRSVA